jgi:hypothetical protein
MPPVIGAHGVEHELQDVLRIVIVARDCLRPPEPFATPTGLSAQVHRRQAGPAVGGRSPVLGGPGAPNATSPNTHPPGYESERPSGFLERTTRGRPAACGSITASPGYGRLHKSQRGPIPGYRPLIARARPHSVSASPRSGPDTDVDAMPGAADSRTCGDGPAASTHDGAPSARSPTRRSGGAWRPGSLTSGRPTPRGIRSRRIGNASCAAFTSSSIWRSTSSRRTSFSAPTPGPPKSSGTASRCCWRRTTSTTC